MRAPEFWRDGDALAGRLLAPAGWLFALGGRIREGRATPWRAPVPVLCVGNLTVGGAGKTPTAMAVAKRLLKAGLRAAFLSRGYGGRLSGPVEVDPNGHRAADVGDEPLLLARVAPTWVARDRRQGAMAAIAEGADAIVMDDGLQNPALRKDVSLVVVDGGFGFGNRRVIPAGPLREGLERGLARASAVVLVGQDELGLGRELGRRAEVIAARLVPDEAARALRGRRVVAFAGIGRPAKFFATLAEIGAEIVARHEFPDHHAFTPDEAMRLAEEANAERALAVTTRKDFVRLPEGAQRMVTAVDVELVFDAPDRLERVLAPVLAAAPAP